MKKIFILILSFNLFVACSLSKKNDNSKNYKELTFFTMDTVIQVKYKGDDKNLENKIKKEFKRIYNKFSPNIKTGVLYKINHRKQNKIMIDRETKYLIRKSLNFSNLSGGVFDITIKPIIDLWGFESQNEKYKIPVESTLKQNLIFVNYKSIKIQDDWLILPTNFKIDLGGIAKGYAVDRAAEIFKNFGIKDFLINAGGDLIAEGENPDSGKWKIGIQNPRGSGIIKIIEVKNKAIATSGDYQRYFIRNNIRYHHIISPFTGTPFRKWISMTITANSCLEADSIATMFFGLDINVINKISKQYEYPIKYYAVNSDKEIFTNL